MRTIASIAGLMLFVLVIPSVSQAQATQAPPPTYTGNFGAGFSLTGGNTDTANFNLAGELTRDPKTKNAIKAQGLYLRSSVSDVSTADRLSLGLRDEYTVSNRTFVYGAFGYMRDPFKEISYLLNPQGGIGYKLIATDRTGLTLNGGGGAVWEKNPDREVQTSGTLNAGENFNYKLSETSKIIEGLTALWKTSDFNDAFYRFNLALATSLTKRAELKVEFIDDFKNVTPSPTIKKNDTAFIVAFLYKF